MADDMTGGSLPYDQWIENALRGVIRQALIHTARHGLPGDHNFYITFRTGVSGVQMAPELLAQHPEEMTIVLQHQFWDLHVEDNAFSVTLKFGGKPQSLRIPFEALTVFGDPSVNFGMQLKTVGEVVAAGRSEKTDAAGVETKSDAVNESQPAPPDTGEVVALDSFRKK
jgi:hypothetical protein